MSGRGDDKSIEPAHQPSACQIPWPTVPTVPWTQGAMSEGRVRRVAAEIMAAAEKRLGDAVAKIECRLERVEADVQRLALRVSDAEDQWRRTRARHEAMFRRVDALEAEVARDAGSDKDEAAYCAEQEAAPPRATGWAVALPEGGCVGIGGGGTPCRAISTPFTVRWLGSRDDAETLARLLGVGRAAELDRVTLEEVG